MTTLYTFDLASGEYTGSRPAQVVNGKELIRSACATLTPPPFVPDGHVARWTGTAWEIVEDHRQKIDNTGTLQGGTPYWLPSEGDNYQSQPRYMKELGPLPEGAVTTKPEMTLDEMKTILLTELNSKFLNAENSGVIDSSVGFKIDATERSLRDISGLITSMSSRSLENVLFCAADNTFHEVTLDQLKQMQLEVIEYGQNLYQQKWNLREEIQKASSIDEIQKIDLSFNFFM